MLKAIEIGYPCPKNLVRLIISLSITKAPTFIHMTYMLLIGQTQVRCYANSWMDLPITLRITSFGCAERVHACPMPGEGVTSLLTNEFNLTKPE
jgi:hypothetical protein